MYLVGDFTRNSIFGIRDVEKRESISKEDLLKAKENADFQVIDLIRLTYFDPAKNEWLKFKNA